MNKKIIAALAFTLVLASCGTKPIDPNDKVLEIKEYTQVMKNGKVLVDPVHGTEQKFWYGAILGTGDTNANGVGYIHLFEDGTSVLTANLNILPRTDKKVFVVWLSDADGKNVVKVGELRSIVGDARHSVKFETESKVTGTPKVFVTVEVSENVKSPSATVAEGILKEPTETK